MFSSLGWRASLPTVGFAFYFSALSLIGPSPLPAQERFPSVARLSFVSGPVTYSRGDDPDEWDDAIENVPLTIGDRIYAPEEGRAELQLSSGNFVRLAPRSYLSTLNLSDDVKQFYLGEGTASFNIKRLQSDEVIEIDTPNVSVTLEELGSYRIAVDQDGNSRITVRRGRVTVAASGRQIAVENGEIRVYGIDSPRYEIVGLPATDAFDRWVAERDDRFERAYADAYQHASDDIIGAEDLAEYGRWEEIPEYGYAWTPSRVASSWAPFSHGRWHWRDPWGWTWISSDRWGWATSHYGRWTPYRSRWYWVPVRPRTRVRYAPACVEFVRVRNHVGWFALHPRDRHIPWWERRDRRRDSHQHIAYVNRRYVTVVNHNNFISARPVQRHIVRDSVIVREAKATRFTSESLPIPNRSSLRIVSESEGRRRGHSPSANVLQRAAVVRTVPPAPVRTFQEKLPEIQKNQGRPLEPSSMLTASQDNRARAHHVRIRPAAEEIRGGDFAPRNPAATFGPAPQPVTAARGKKLATHETSLDMGRAERAEKPSTPQQPAQPSPSQPNQGVAGKPASPTTEQERDRQRQETHTAERGPKAQQLELDGKKPDQRPGEQRKAQLQKHQQDQRRQEPSPQERPSREQQRLEELERRQAQQQREEERKAHLQQNRGEQQQHREQLRQQQLQERQTQQQRHQEQERKTQLQHQQQDRARREQLRQQQLHERQAHEQLQREQERNAQSPQRQEQLRAQQFRQQQPQGREARQVQRQQQHDRRQQQLQERQLPQLPKPMGQPQRPGL